MSLGFKPFLRPYTPTCILSARIHRILGSRLFLGATLESLDSRVQWYHCRTEGLQTAPGFPIIVGKSPRSGGPRASSRSHQLCPLLATA